MASLIGPPWRRLRHRLLGFFMAFLTKAVGFRRPVGAFARWMAVRLTLTKFSVCHQGPLPIRSGCSKRVTDTANGRGELKRRETAPSLHARVMGYGLPRCGAYARSTGLPCRRKPVTEPDDC